MRVGINLLFNPTGGSLTNLIVLLEEWSSASYCDQTIIYLFISPQALSKLPKFLLTNFKVKVCPKGGTGNLWRMLTEQAWLPFAIWREQIDILYCPANTTPFLPRSRIVVTFQNLAPYDQGVGWSEMGFLRSIRFRILRWMMYLAVLRADRILVGSQYFLKLINRKSPRSRGKTFVVPRSTPRRDVKQLPNLASVKFDRTLNVQTPYLLCVSHLHPYKKLNELIEGFHIAKTMGVPERLQLVIVGAAYLSNDYARSCWATTVRLGLKEDEVIFTGERQRKEVDVLLANSDAFIFPSVCENCPTALVEAIRFGKPILCSDRSSIPEVAGNAALYFDPTKPEEIAGRIIEFYDDPSTADALARQSAIRALELPQVDEMSSQTWAHLTTVV